MYLYEHEKIDVTQNVQLKDLEKYIISNLMLRKYFKYEWGILKTKHYCGILNFNKNDYFILPKISRNKNDNLDIFMYMLIYTYDIKLENEEIGSCKNHKHNIIEVFVQMFARNLLKELKKGIYKEYITENDNLSTLKGKYLVNENLKYNFTKSKIYCEYDEFSMNNTLNQFFMYTIKYLINSVNDKKLLKQCELIFDEVESVSFDIKNLNINFNRLNIRFKQSYELAILLLNQFIPIFKHDKHSFAFLFDMNILFEKFIGKIIKNNYENVIIPKNNKDFGELSLRPDIILNDKNLIIDCKYKIIKQNEGISRNDKYQMYVYGNNYYKEINKTMLIYPKNNNDNIIQTTILGDNERKIKLFIRSIDLNMEISTYSNYINKISNQIGEILDGL
ncbi:McrC family protein [Aliarcobacter butzleri]|uniref:McrC family protein n=1 Tax=Aliarcobacter butzleri TaxID=28197 RepID=UPI001EDF5154|nr:McrC family protein [Aliarcobacter butzleri]MCG3696803.1 McrC family protein [Aliarcobacter butzleri]